MVDEQRIINPEPIEVVRAQIAAKVVEFVKTVRGRNTLERSIYTELLNEINELIPDHLVISTHTGSGKTTSVMKALDEIGARWIYIAPFHDVIVENIEDSPIRYYNFLHLKGRKECCHVPENRDLADAGIDISGFCEDCPFKHTICTYESNMKKAYETMPNLAITHAHIQHWLPKFLDTRTSDGLTIRDHYHVAIIDENPINCFIQSMNVTRLELSYIHQCILLTGMHRHNRYFKKIVDFIELLSDPEIDYDTLTSFPLDDVVSKRYGLLRDYSKKIGELLQQRIIIRPPTDILNHLLNLWEFRIGNDIEQMIYWRGHMLNLSYFNRFALNFDLPIVALDGTANQVVWEHMLHTTNFEIFSKDYTYTNVYQGQRSRHGIGSWLFYGDKTAIYLTKLIAGIAKAKTRNVLIVGTKRINRKIQELIAPSGVHNLVYATYYFLRSKNHYYKTCDTIILACEPNPPQETIESCVSLSGWDESIWRLIYREEEMLQAIGRLRQNIKILSDDTIREKMDIYIFSNTGVDITTMKSHLLPEGSQVITMRKHFMIDTAESGGAINDHIKVLLAMEEGRKFGITSIQKGLLGCGYSTANNVIVQMYGNNLIYKEGRKYGITEKGLDQLSKRI